MRFEPAGLHVVDVRGWTTRMLDQDADAFRFTGGRLAASGMGVAGYMPDGAERFRLFEGKQAWVVEAFAGRAYVAFERGPMAVVYIERCAVVGERSTPVPRLLLDDGVSLFGRR